MARIALVGGHGKVALLAHPKLVAAGHEVTAIIRNSDHVDDVAATGARPEVADVEQLDGEQMREIFEGHDVVVWSAGAGGGNPSRTYAVDRDAAIRSINATAKAGIRRYVMVSYHGASTDHGVAEDSSFYAYAEAKAAADEYLRGAGLDHTILMPSRLTTAPTSGITLPAEKAGNTSRELVADVILAAIAHDSTIGKDLPFTDGDQPVSEAVAAF